ncbi:MAG: hypothetical protein AB7E55_01215 [Pigmentiphaga sp.]
MSDTGYFYDFDAMLPPDIEVKIGGRMWTFPGDVSFESVLKLIQMADEVQSGNISALQGMADQIKALFAQRHSQEELKEMRLSMPQVLRLAHLLLNVLGGAGEGEVDPTALRRPKSQLKV